MNASTSIVTRPRMLLVWGLLIALAPFVLMATIVWHEFDKPMTSFVPRWADEICYWQETRSLHDHGLDCGSFVNEQDAVAGRRQIDVHGPAFPLCFALLALFSGWAYSTPFFWNVALLGISMLAFVRIAKLDGYQLLLFSFLVLLFSPILLYTPSMMQESLHYSLALLIAGCIVKMVRTKPVRAQLQPSLLFFLLVFIALLLRPTWSIALIVFLPFFSWRNRGILLIEMAGGFISTMFLWVPSGTVLHSLGLSESAGIPDFILAMWNHIANSVPLFLGKHWGFRGSQSLPSEVEVLLRYQALLLAAVTAILSFIVWKAKRSWRKIPMDNKFLFSFHLANLGGIIVALLLFWDIFDFRDFRTLAPHVLLSMCVMIADARFRTWLWVCAISNVLCLPFCLGTFDVLHEEHFPENDEPIKQFQTELAGVMHYTPEAPMWNNTIAIAPAYWQYMQDYLAIPSGFGFSFYEPPWPLHFKSKYIIAPPEQIQEWGDAVKLRPIRMTSVGMLYENLSR